MELKNQFTRTFKTKTLFHSLLIAGLVSATAIASIEGRAALVTVDENGVRGEGYIEGDRLTITADQFTENGTVGIEASGYAGLMDSSSFFSNTKINLASVADSVGVLLSNATPEGGQGATRFLVYGNMDISAQTAIRGDGEIWFVSNDDEPQTASVNISGALDMARGTMTAQASTVTYAGDGELGRYRTVPQEASHFNVGEGVIDGATAVLRIDEVNLTSGSIAVNGSSQSDPNAWRLGSALLVHDLTNNVGEDFAGQSAREARISVTGNATLALGTQLDRANERLDASVRDNIAGFDDLSVELQVRARLAHILADADIMTNNPNSTTLITAAGLTQQAVPDNVTVTVGEVSGETSPGGVYLGEDARWVIYYGEESEGAAAKNASDEALLVHASKDSQLIIYGWDGKAQLPDLTLLGFAEENVYSLNGVRTHIVDGQLARLWCWQFEGLQSSEIVRAVEEGYSWGAVEARPGYSFIVDSFDPDRVGPESYVNVVDSAVFLPASSGALAALERVERDIVESILSHDYVLYANEGHWWVQGQAANYDAPEMFSSGRGRRGFEADAVYGTLGFDIGLWKNWIGSIAVSFSSIDIDAKGLVTTLTSEASSASATASVARYFDAAALKIALSYTRAEITAKALANGHRLESEPELEIFSGAVRLETRFGDELVLSPMLQAGVHYAKFDEGAVSDATESVYGTGFETSAGKRLWTTITAGVGASSSFEVDSLGLRVAPRIDLSATAAAGDKNWEMRSALFDGTASSTASFASARDYSVRIAAALDLLRTGTKPRMEGGIFGIGAKPTGKEDPFGWSVALTAAYETGSDSEKSSTFGVRFRQMF